MIEGAFRRYEHDLLIGAGRYQRVGRYPGFARRRRGEPVGGSFGTDPTSVIAGPIRDRAAKVVVGSDRVRQRRQVDDVLDEARRPGAIGLRHGVDVIDERAQRVIADGCTVRHVDPDTPLAGIVVDAVPGFPLPPSPVATPPEMLALEPP